MDADLLTADTLDEGYRIEPFAEQTEVTEADILELWRRENVLPATEAEKPVPSGTTAPSLPAPTGWATSP